MHYFCKSLYVKKHLDEINVDGEHAIVHRGKWHFDEIAIARLEQMRGYNDGNGVPLTRTPVKCPSLSNNF